MTEPPIDPSGEPEPPAPESEPDEEEKTTPEKDEDTAAEYVDDSQLPEDLRPSDDNPLAQNPDE